MNYASEDMSYTMKSKIHKHPGLKSIENSLTEMFCKTAVLQNFIKFKEKHLCRHLFLALDLFTELLQSIASKYILFTLTCTSIARV